MTVAFREPPIIMQEVARERHDPTSAVAHEIEKIIGEGENCRAIKHEKIMLALDATKDKHGLASCCEEGVDLIIAKGTHKIRPRSLQRNNLKHHGCCT